MSLDPEAVHFKKGPQHLPIHGPTQTDTDMESNTESSVIHENWSPYRFWKTIALSLVIIATLVGLVCHSFVVFSCYPLQAAFIAIPEAKDEWVNIAPKSSTPVYINLTNDLDLINPVWNIKARGPFLPPELANLSNKHVTFNLILLKSDHVIDRFNKPFRVPVASSDSDIDVSRSEVTHSFILSGSHNGDPDYDEDFLPHIFDDDTTYQLEVSTNDKVVVPIALSVSAMSDLSLKGILMAGAVLIFLYVLIIFEIVHRTLAAMIGATAAIACLTLIHDVSSKRS